MSMYLEHFGLREPPFRITPHTDFFFDGAKRGSTLDALIYAIINDEGIVKVTGEVGSGKTMLCRMLLEKLPSRVATVYLANPSLSRDALLHALADELGIPAPPERTYLLLRTLQQHLVDLHAAGRQVVVLIDEAHAMPPESLEEVRLLSNLETGSSKLLQIVLFGQPELDEVLAAPAMRQLRERITHGFALEPLQRSDVGTYLMFRLRAAGYRGPDPFTGAAVRLIASASRGLTRRINILADKALLAAYAENLHLVTPRQARAAIRDAQFRPLRTPTPLTHWRRWLAAGATGGLLSLAAWWLAAASPRTSAPDAAANGVQSSSAVNSGAPSGSPDNEANPREPRPLTAEATTSMTIADRDSAFRNWLEHAADDHYVIQLVRTRGEDAAQIEDYLTQAARALDPSQLRAYKLTARGQEWRGVIYGDYPSHSAASAALHNLPEGLRQAGAYPRAVKTLRP